MRAAAAIALSLVILSSAMIGCVKQDQDIDSPLGKVPKILVDNIDGVTKVYVKGLDDYMYENITIRAYNGTTTFATASEDNTYIQQMHLTQRKFTLNISCVFDKNNIYGFEGNFTVFPADEPSVAFTITTYNKQGDLKEKKVAKSDLPWRTLADEF